ncbi:glutaredoxin family protein [Mesobacillus zeae]|nr:glutaredoxin family protein [Mesobacillus zeae]
MGREVIVYTMEHCKFCEEEKEWLKSRGIPYEERNIVDNPSYLHDLEKRGVYGTPFTLIREDAGEEKAIKGFNQDVLEEYLGGMAKR